MILQALKEYYDRKGNELPPVGWIRQALDYSIVLNRDGSFQQLNLLSTKDAKGKRVPAYRTVPCIGKQALKHTNAGDDANLLWDKAEFVLGLGGKGEQKRASFLAALRTWILPTEDPGIAAVLRFLEAGQKTPKAYECVLKHKDYGEDICSGRPNISFRILEDECEFVFDRPVVKTAIASRWANLTEDSGLGRCLVTGKKEGIETCHTVIKGVWNAQMSGAPLVGYNKSSFCSYRKEKGTNGPVSKIAAFAYTTALNHLLHRESRQRLVMGDATVVFWSERQSGLESQLVDIFGERFEDKPDRCAQSVADLYTAVKSGAFMDDQAHNRFYVLGLAPNESRLSVRFWHIDTVVGLACKIKQHFDDLTIVHGPKEPPALSLQRLLCTTAVMGKPDNIPPNLAGDTVRAILEGQPYPTTLLHAAVRRARAEQAEKNKRTGKLEPNVPYERAALIKACINRTTRYSNPNEKEELKVSLDYNNTNPGYRLGRLFATLEKIQSEANPGINATIRDRFYGAASSTPMTVFGNLMRLKNHHLAKLKSVGRRVYFEKWLGEIIGGRAELPQEPVRKIDGIVDFPAHLSLADQGRFAIGYYHQMQAFFRKTDPVDRSIPSNSNNPV